MWLLKKVLIMSEYTYFFCERTAYRMTYESFRVIEHLLCELFIPLLSNILHILERYATENLCILFHCCSRARRMLGENENNTQKLSNIHNSVKADRYIHLLKESGKRGYTIHS